MRAGIKEKPEFKAQRLESLQFMASYYSAQCELTHDPLYDLCLKITVKALENELDGGGLTVVTSPNRAQSSSPCTVVGAETRGVLQGGLSAVQPSTASILLRMLDDGKSRPIDGLIFASGKSAGEVSSELLKLELGGKVRKLPGSRYSRKLK